ncbi:MAG: ThuA domain-containing protein, partial [Candidatus Saccharicenans sp.]
MNQEKKGKYSRLIFGIILFILLAISPVIFAGAAESQAKKKALIVWGGWEGHEPKKCVDIFAPWLKEQNFEVEISNTLDAYLDLEKLKKLDVIIQVWTQGTITPEQERNLEEAVKSGVGLAGWHGGLADSFRMNT